MQLIEQAQLAKQAAVTLATVSTACKNQALFAMAAALEAQMDEILNANEQDCAAAAAAGKGKAFIDRLQLNAGRILAMANGLKKVADLNDPVGSADCVVHRPNGLTIEKRRVPLGVIGIIYEARPNVTADAIGLCVKSGNACLLRGGSEAIRSNLAIASCMEQAALTAGLPRGAFQILSDTSRETAAQMMRLNGYIDVLIPRGGAGLIQQVVQQATVPVIETGVGVCHAYVEASADINMAASIVENAKCSRPSVCNALETLLVDKSIAEKALPVIANALVKYHTVLRCDPAAKEILPDSQAATEEDWATEYGDYILSVKVVDGIDQALSHIRRYGTRHSECIVTNDYAKAQRFLNEVDAAAVYVNASTRFTDGEEFGLGAEIGISTQKLHARGPMGLYELTTVKYVIRGEGQIR